MVSQPRREMAATKLGLIAVFLGTFAAVASTPPFRRRHKKGLDLPLSDLAMLAVATFRLGRLVAFDEVLEPVRAPVAETRPDPSGAGDTVVPRGRGARRALGQLITCPICAGTWIAAGLVYALHLLPSPTRLFLLINSTVGAVEMMNAVTESLSWTGEAARKTAGEKG
jgi:hypothetical protein